MTMAGAGKGSSQRARLEQTLAGNGGTPVDDL
jgi:hypothetical protein